MYTMAVPVEKAPDKATYIEIEYENGNPTTIDGRKMSPAGVLSTANRLGGENGIGRVDLVENRYVGMKSRGVYETPGGTILHIAHRAIESITLDREVLHLRDSLIPRYAELVYCGYWFAPEREMMQGMIDEIQKDVSGKVRLKLYKGNCQVVGRKSSKSLYRPDIATFEDDKGLYNQKDAEGFIKLNALRLRIRAMMGKR
jgi:argininosuccinate synthase